MLWGNIKASFFLKLKDNEGETSIRIHDSALLQNPMCCSLRCNAIREPIQAVRDLRKVTKAIIRLLELFDNSMEIVISDKDKDLVAQNAAVPLLALIFLQGELSDPIIPL